MRAEYIIKQANQIASFFESMPDQAQADRDFVAHIRKFWDPRMRRDLLDLVAGLPLSDAHPMVIRALRAHGALLV
jgi:formate dehydrogenase subunit delta